jgi:DNA adenine methylase
LQFNNSLLPLNDINFGLVTFHRAVYSKLPELIIAIRKIQAEFLEALKSDKAREYFNMKRIVYNRLKKQRDHETISVELASLFLFLVKSSYGALYRENLDGEFNASFALANRGLLFLRMSLSDFEEQQQYLKKQRSFRCSCLDYKEALRTAKKNDFVFLDPPYWVQAKGNFTNYSQDNFGLDEQHKVFQVFNELNRRGCKVMLMNNNIPPVRELYKDFKQVTIYTSRSLQHTDRSRSPAELAITNYT